MPEPHPPIEDDEEGAGADEGGSELQFDEAEPITPALSGTTCVRCNRLIMDAYFEINGKVLCTSCRQQIEAAFHGGSAAARVIKSIVFGAAACIVGAVLYYAILVATHANIGLVAIAVGYIVGRAVRKGSDNRSGPFYQVLAVFFTYTSIGLMIFAYQARLQEMVAPGLAWDFLRRIDFTIYSLPVTETKEHLISGLIYCFALWEAWRITTPAQLVFNGPFQISAAPAPRPLQGHRTMANDQLALSQFPPALTCPGCGSEVAPSLLACPSCRRLVHAEKLKELAESAARHEQAGDYAGALASWREATEMLPHDTRQYTVIAGHIERLGRLAESQPAQPGQPQSKQSGQPREAPPSRWSGGVISGVLGTVALAIWKFKFIAVALLTKGKLLLLGLTKASTFFSMFAMMGVYWTVFGGWLAVGLVLSIYVHEMGHVFALMRYGVKASAPLFIPGLGAVVLLKQSLVDPKQDARVGLAGPIWGTAAALACAGVYQLTSVPIWAALAMLGAYINLFNLLPFWQLDGARAFRSLNRSQRWLAVASIATAWALTDQGLLVLLLAVGVWHTIADKPAKGSDPPIVAQYAILVMILSALSLLPVPMGP